MKYKFAILFIYGRANFGTIHTDVTVREANEQEQEEYEGEAPKFFVMAQNDEEIVNYDEDVVPNTVIEIDEVEFMVGDDLDQMIEIYSKHSVANFDDDMVASFAKMKQNLNEEQDLS